jgi:hypothetical protein
VDESLRIGQVFRRGQEALAVIQSQKHVLKSKDAAAIKVRSAGLGTDVMIYKKIRRKIWRLFNSKYYLL